MAENRRSNPTFRILSAIGIVIVVSAHASNSGGVSLAYSWFEPYSFLIALFVFISGYFYKEEDEGSVGRFLLRKAKRLLLPLYLWTLFYCVLDRLLLRQGFYLGAEPSVYSLLLSPLVDGHAFGFNLATWFVAPLFFTEVVNLLLRRLCGRIRLRSELFFLILYLATGIFGVQWMIAGHNVGWELALGRVMFFLPCFQFGRLYRTHLERLDRAGNLLYFSVLLAIQLVLRTLFPALSYTISLGTDFANGPVIPFVTALTGIAFWLRIARILTPLLENSRVVRTLSESGFWIMANHFLGFFLLNAAYYGVFSRTSLFADFPASDFHSTVWCFYFPFGSRATAILYLAAGILLPLGMRACWKWTAARLGRLRLRRKKTETAGAAPQGST